MAKIKIICKREIGFRDYNQASIYLDHRVIGTMHPGESNEFDVEKGSHKLQIKMGIYSSKEFAFTTFDNDFKSFLISNDFSGFSLIIIFSVIYTVFFVLLLITHNESFFPLAITIMGVTIFVYYFLFRKSSFLRIKEVSHYRP